MSSDPFLFLGLDRATATDADVRRAYAERLKVTRPEDDREGFLALRDAFERARLQTSARASDAQHTDEPDQSFPEPGPHTGGRATDHIGRQDSALARAQDVFDVLSELLRRRSEGADIAEVSSLLGQDDLADMEVYEHLQTAVRQFLCIETGMAQHPPEMTLPSWLTVGVFETLDEHFGWTKQSATRSAASQQNAWLIEVYRQLRWWALPQAARKEYLLESYKKTESRNGIGIGEILSILMLLVILGRVVIYIIEQS